MVCKAEKYYREVLGWSRKLAAERAKYYADTITACSCGWGCGNRRNYAKGDDRLTWQERKALLDMGEQIRHHELKARRRLCGIVPGGDSDEKE